MHRIVLLLAILTLSGFAACPATTGPMGATADDPEIAAADELPEPVQSQPPLGDGIGAKGDSTTIPEFSTLFMTLPGQPERFTDIPPRTVDYNVWFLDDGNEQYRQDVTARFFHQQLFTAGTTIPENPHCPFVTNTTGRNQLPCACTQEILDSEKVQLRCEGKFPFAHGQMLRLIICGQPNPNVLKQTVGNARNPIAEFIDRAYVHSNKELWDLEFCPERRYVDYVFKAADMELAFPLESGKLYFVTQFPRDYLGKEAEYGEPVPNHLGIHNTIYESNHEMGRFLSEGRIVQVVTGVPASNAAPKAPYINFSYSSADSDEPRATSFSAELPNTPYCDKLAARSPEQLAWEKELFELINEIRVAGADCRSEGIKASAPPLDISPVLYCTACLHSQDMYERAFVSHTNPDGLSVFWRSFLASQVELGQPLVEVFSRLGENIVHGPTTPAAALKHWLANDRHCANLMDPYFTHAGTGSHHGNDQGRFWTLALGTQLK